MRLRCPDAERQEREVDRHVDDDRIEGVVPNARYDIVGRVGLEVGGIDWRAAELEMDVGVLQVTARPFDIRYC